MILDKVYERRKSTTECCYVVNKSVRISMQLKKLLNEDTSGYLSKDPLLGKYKSKAC